MKTKVLGKMNQNLLLTVSMLFLFIGERSISVHCTGFLYEPKIPNELLENA